MRLEYENYLNSDVWKCKKSPTGAHYWIVGADKMRCQYCKKTKPVTYRTIYDEIKERRAAAYKKLYTR